jgi:hypothetical protein
MIHAPVRSDDVIMARPLYHDDPQFETKDWV